ncbi:hypothetical protein [Paenibacillus mendelii]|uniref:Uncharacterized protein n=1 Tax=Paenibacillus mendelii TaxID=206163 RepID=A0ABV6JFZ4_9BACL|nr:hypothetical protein [Paenibacillus mendelii]MCQ6557707.1 hypothetical protein [Paenibacillus mendelii]
MTDLRKLAGEQPVHDYYRHAEQAYALLPDTMNQLQLLKEAFGRADEDFLAIELRTMIDRLEEIQKLMAEGPQG